MKSPKINNSKGGHVIVEKVRYMISDAAALAGVETVSYTHLTLPTKLEV